MRGHENFRNRSRFGPIKARGNLSQMTFRHCDEFCLRAAAGNTKDAFAGFPHPRFIANFCHLAGEFQPGNILRKTRWRRIASQPLQDVGAIDAGCAHAHSDAISGWRRRVGRLADAENFDTTMRFDLYGAHESNNYRVDIKPNADGTVLTNRQTGYNQIMRRASTPETSNRGAGTARSVCESGQPL